MTATTIDPSDVQRFAHLSKRWWDPQGPFRPLHWFNPARVQFIADGVGQQAGRDPARVDVLRGLRALDVGCGGGLLSEALARRGAEVTAVDADAQAVAVARDHAEKGGLSIRYHAGEVGALPAEATEFDVVVASEVIEHVADVPLFLDQLVARTRPGGLVVVTTLNRTAQSFLLGKVAAEYVLGWVPRGTHRWRQFLKPSEVAQGLTERGCRVVSIKGIVVRPGLRGPKLVLDDRDTSVNYALAAVKAQ